MLLWTNAPYVMEVVAKKFAYVMGVNRYFGGVVRSSRPVIGTGGYSLPVADRAGVVLTTEWQNYTQIAKNKGV